MADSERKEGAEGGNTVSSILRLKDGRNRDETNSVDWLAIVRSERIKFISLHLEKGQN